MSNRINRYKSAYDLIKRPNNVAAWPRHVFMRGQNLHSNMYDRVGDRESGHLSDDWSHTSAEQIDADDEQDVVEALG